MTDWEASEKRISCRSYADRRLDGETMEKLRVYMEQLNGISGLHMQLISTDTPTLALAKTMFDGPVYTYIAAVGEKSSEGEEKVGYYGEDLVLYATKLGLGTCWVAGTYDRASAQAEVQEGENLWDVIPVGYATEKMPLRQKVVRQAIRARSRRPEEFLESEEKAPEWVLKGIEGVMRGPSAANRQPVNIVWKDGKVFARLWKSDKGLAYNDLGIAKKQFEVGAAQAGVKGHFLPGDMAEFVTESLP